MASEQVKELEERLMAAEDCIEKIDALNALAFELIEDDPGRANKLAEQALNLSSGPAMEGKLYVCGNAKALITLGELANNASAYSLTITRLTEAYTLLNGEPFPDLLATASHTLGWAHSRLGNYTEAFTFLEQSLNIYRELSDQEKEAEVLTSLGSLYNKVGKPAQGMESFQQALKLQNSQRLTRARGVTLNNLAYAQMISGAGDEAVKNASAGIQIFVVLGLRKLEASTRDTLGLAYSIKAEWENAEAAFKKSLAISELFGFEYIELETTFNLGKVYIQQGRSADVLRRYFETALKKAEARQLNRFLFQFHEILAGLYEKQGDLNISLQHYKQFHQALDLSMAEAANNRIANLKLLHQVEKKQKEAEVLWLQNQALKTEINERQRERGLLEKLATTDPLTGLYNRQYLFTLGEYELEKNRKMGLPLSIIFIDIDHFKLVNDTYGHAVGDIVLIELSKLLLKLTEDGGICCRYGGEEFLVLVPNVKLIAVQAMADEIRQTVSSTPIHSECGEIGITVSLGVVKASPADVDLSAVIARADQALYRAKSSGRNCVSI